MLCSLVSVSSRICNSVTSDSTTCTLCSTIVCKQKSYRKTSISALLTMPKPFTVWITKKCGKFWKRWEYQTTWPVSWETCMQVRKQYLGDPKREAFSLPVCGFPRGTSNSWAIGNSLNKSQQKYSKFHQGLLAGAVRTALNFAYQAEWSHLFSVPCSWIATTRCPPRAPCNST